MSTIVIMIISCKNDLDERAMHWRLISIWKRKKPWMGIFSHLSPRMSYISIENWYFDFFFNYKQSTIVEKFPKLQPTKWKNSADFNCIVSFLIKTDQTSPTLETSGYHKSRTKRLFVRRSLKGILLRKSFRAPASPFSYSGLLYF